MHAFPVIRTPLKRRVFRTIDRFVFRRVDHFISVSGSLENSLIESGIPGSKISVIPNSLDLIEFKPGCNQQWKESFGLSPSQLAIGVIGRLHPGKGLVTFIMSAAKTLERFPDVRFFIIGQEMKTSLEDLNFTRELNSIIRNLNLSDKIILTGFESGLNNVMKSLDIVVSASPEETFGLTLLEAMATGIPVIGCNTGGIPELIENDGNGLLVNPGSVEELSDAISRMIVDETLRVRLGLKGRETAESNYDITKNIISLENLLEKCYKDKETSDRR